MRHTFGLVLGGPFQVLAFVDSQRVTVNKDPWVAGVNRATLSGAGLGLRWVGAHQWQVKAYVADPIGSAPNLVGIDHSVHAWAEIDKGF